MENPRSEANPLDVVKGGAVVPSVVELCRSTVRMAGNPLGHFEVASILKVSGDSRCSEAVARESAPKIRISDPALNHLVGIGRLMGLSESFPVRPIALRKSKLFG